jgi:hypothetical protein
MSLMDGFLNFVRREMDGRRILAVRWLLFSGMAEGAPYAPTMVTFHES